MCCPADFTKYATRASGARAPRRCDCSCNSNCNRRFPLRRPSRKCRQTRYRHECGHRLRRCARSVAAGLSIGRAACSARPRPRCGRNRHDAGARPLRPRRPSHTACPDAPTRRARSPRPTLHTVPRDGARDRAPVARAVDPARQTPRGAVAPHGGEPARATNSIASLPRFSSTEVWRRLRDAKPLFC